MKNSLISINWWTVNQGLILWSSFKLAIHQIKIDWQIRKQFLLLWKADNICKRCVWVWRGDRYTLQSSLFLSGTIYLIFVLDKKYFQIIMKKLKTIFFFNADIHIWLTPLPRSATLCFWLSPLSLGADILCQWPRQKLTSRVSKVRNKKN